jgi:anti-anti-sigma factor
MDLDEATRPAADFLHVDATGAADERYVRLILKGELDSETAPLLLSAFGSVLSQPSAELVELDLADLAFVGAAGLRCLLECQTAVHRAGARMILRDPSSLLVRLLNVVGLRSEFTISPAIDFAGRDDARRRICGR